MNKEELKQLIVSHKHYFLNKKGLSHRENLQRNTDLLKAKEVVFISGIRRSGKSSLMHLAYLEYAKQLKIKDSNLLFINFEDERLFQFDVSDFETLWQAFLELDNPQGKKYLLFDEIQNVKGWERWINRLYEFEDVKIFITGSNATMLQSDISSSLTGRNRQLGLFTFSFREFAALSNTDYMRKNLYDEKAMIKINRLLEKYMSLGGFPEVLKQNNVALSDQYFKDIIYRDIIGHYNIRNNNEVKALALYLINNTGKIASYKRLASLIEAKNVTTIKNYIDIFQDVYLILPLALFSSSLRKQLYNPKKYYVSDIGFYHSVGFSFSPDYGRLLENLVVLDLLRQEKDVYYWHSKKGHEVDFVIQHKNTISQAIQVCYILNKENQDREVRALLEASKQLNVDKLHIITMGQKETVVEEGKTIEILPYAHWLLMSS